MNEVLLRQILDEIKEVKANVQGLVTRMSGLETHMDILEKGQQELKADVQTLHVDVRGLKSGQLELTAFRDRKEETDAKLEAMAMDIHQINGDMTALKEGQRRHERILERFALRFFEHEAEIAKLQQVK